MAEFVPCGHSALGCYNGSGACCSACDHGTYWRNIYRELESSNSEEADQ